MKPEVFLIGVSQTESPTSTPKVVALDSSYDGRLRRKRSLIKDEVDKSLWSRDQDVDHLCRLICVTQWIRKKRLLAVFHEHAIIQISVLAHLAKLRSRISGRQSARYRGEILGVECLILVNILLCFVFQERVGTEKREEWLWPFGSSTVLGTRESGAVGQRKNI